MFKKFSFDSQPAIWISYKLFIVRNWSDNLKIKILKIIAFSSSDCFNFELVFRLFEDSDESFHFVSIPLYQKEDASFILKSWNSFYVWKICYFVRIIS
jgi:hypothetical protein